MTDKPFVCPRCGFVSYHPKDKEFNYCAHCRVFIEDAHAMDQLKDNLEKAYRSDMKKKTVMAMFWISLFTICTVRLVYLFLYAM